MEFEQGVTRPKPLLARLRQQVEDQSDLCDFTLTHGHWSKRFHSSVLVASPFFQCVRQHNFQEKSKGSVDFGICTPSSIEASIMFLYQRRPDLDMSNIANILEMAEFLLIPNLKSLCVQWLNSKRVTHDNVAEFVCLSGLFGFDIPECTTFVRQHVPELLERKETIPFTKETIWNLYSDKTLVYVTMETKFRYLVRWTKQCLKQRKCYFDELLSLVDLQEVSQSTFETTKADPDLNYTSLRSAQQHDTSVSDKNNIVLLGEQSIPKRQFWAFDTIRETWHTLQVEEYFSEYSRFNHISCKEQGSSVIYSKCNNKNSVTILDLDKGTLTKSILLGGFQITSNVVFESDTCFATVDHYSNAASKHRYGYDTERDEIEISTQLMSGRLNSSNRISKVKTINQPVNVLYAGRVNQMGGNTEMTPLLSIPNISNMKLCVNTSKVVAIYPPLTGKKSVVWLYNANTCQLDTVQLYRSNTICSTDTGFIMLKENSIVYIYQDDGHSNANKYQIREIDLQATGSNQDNSVKYCKYISVVDRLFRCDYMYSRRHECKTYYAMHKDILSCSLHDGIWKSIPMPNGLNDLRELKDLVMISLPKAKLGCHVDCPHCKYTELIF